MHRDAAPYDEEAIGWTTCFSIRRRRIEFNNAMNPTVRPVTRLAVLAPPRISSNGHAQGARPSRPAGYRGR